MSNIYFPFKSKKDLEKEMNKATWGTFSKRVKALIKKKEKEEKAHEKNK